MCRDLRHRMSEGFAKPGQTHHQGRSYDEGTDTVTRNPTISFVGEANVSGQGGHHAVPAVINGKPYMVAAKELSLGGCENGAFPRIWDISDERKPRVVGEFRPEVMDHCSDPRVEAESASIAELSPKVKKFMGLSMIEFVPREALP